MVGGRGTTESWVTIVSNDIEALQALVLVSSIRRSYSGKKCSIIISFKGISSTLRHELYNAFDYCVEEKEDDKCEQQQRVLLQNCWKLTCWTKCVYISPNSLVFENCDNLFENYDEFSAVDEYGPESPNNTFSTNLFVYKPNITRFMELRGVTQALINEHQNEEANDCRNHNIIFHQQNQHILHTFFRDWVKIPSSYGVGLKNYDGDPHTNYNWTQDMNPFILHFNYERLLRDFTGTEKNSTFYSRNYECLIKWRQIYIQELTNTLNQFQMNGVSKQLHRLLESLKLPLNSSPVCNIHKAIGTSHEQEELLLEDSIAIIGMSCRFPGANSPEEFWNVLAQGVDTIKPFPSEREIYTTINKKINNPSLQKEEGFECGTLACPVDEFDARFFGISPREAAFIDPQQRLLLEVTWEAIEASGIAPLSLKGTRTSAYVGIHMRDYEHFLDPTDAQEYHHSYLGNAFSATASRISYFLGLTGPNLAIESGCSSSLVAVHLGCESLKRGESSLALASGVNLILEKNLKDGSTLMAVLSPDSRCKTFDESANGFARAEGVGCVVMKRARDAYRDGDNVLALICGSAINNDGAGQSFGTPNSIAQEKVIREALRTSNLTPTDVNYVEAHGTGTSVGDPLEVLALSRAYGSSNRKEPLYIGSVKTNIGHTESAAGIAGIIKTILCLKHKAIPPNLHLNKLNPAINLNLIPAIIPTKLTEWTSSQKIAGVSSFSMSGTSGHVIIQEAPPKSRNFSSDHTGEKNPIKQHLITISAKSLISLEALILKYHDYFGKNSHLSLEDIAYTSNVCRSHFSHRASIIASNMNEIIIGLAERSYTVSKTGTAPPQIAFLFTGQGSQYLGMGKEMYYWSRAFKLAFDECEFLFNKLIGVTLKEIMWGLDPGDENRLEETIYCQPAIFCLEYALVAHWKSLGIIPEAVLGHSVGEFAAAVTSGLLTLEDGMKLVVQRSRLVQTLPKCSMLVLKTNYQTACRLIKEFQASSAHGGGIDIAADNSSNEVVVSGSTQTISDFEFFSTNNDIRTKKLASSHAFHSRAMDPIMTKFEAYVASKISYERAQLNCVYISGTHAKPMKVQGFASTPYWIQHFRQTVKFSQAIKSLAKTGCNIFIEIGPSPILLGLTMANLDYSANNTFCASLQHSMNDREASVNTLSKLYLAGVDLSWEGLYKQRKQRVDLPTYAFDRQKYWFTSKSKPGGSELDIYNTETPSHPILGQALRTPLSEQIYSNQLHIGARHLEYLQHHKVGSLVVLPAAAFVEASLGVARNLLHGSTSTPLVVENIYIEAALQLQATASALVETVIKEEMNKSDGLSYNISFNCAKATESSGELKTIWKKHARGKFVPGSELPSANSNIIDIEQLKSNLSFKDTNRLKKSYHSLISKGIEFGQAFQSLKCAWTNSNQILTEIEIPSSLESNDYVCHPIIIDAMIQTFAFGFTLDKNEVELDHNLQLPLSIGSFIWLGKPMTTAAKLYAYCSRSSLEKEEHGHILLFNSNGSNLLAIMRGLELVKIHVDSFVRSLMADTNPMPRFYQQIWRPAPGIINETSRIDLKKIPSIQEIRPTNSVIKDIDSKAALHEESQINLLCFYYIAQAIQTLHWKYPLIGEIFMETESWAKCLPHALKKTKVHLTFINELIQRGYIEPNTMIVHRHLPSLQQCAESIPQLEVSLSNSCVHEQILYNFAKHCGQHLQQILIGDLKPLSVLYASDPTKVSARKFTAESNFSKLRHARGKQILQTQFEKVASLNSNKILRILEIGGGTGIASTMFLEVISELEIPYQYTFTDISPQVIEEAKITLVSYTPNVTYHILDIDRDPLGQGFCPDNYDLIVACQVIHVASCIQTSLQHLNLLLRDGGLVYIWEYYRIPTHAKISFALLDSYWKFTDNHLRSSSPMLELSNWKRLLGSCGFSNIEDFYETNEFGGNGGDGGIVARKSLTNCKFIQHPLDSLKLDRTWILFSSKDQVAGGSDLPLRELTSKLLSLGRSVLLVNHKSTIEKIQKCSQNEYLINFQMKSQFEQLFMEALQVVGTANEESFMSLDGIVYFSTNIQNPTPASMEDIQKTTCGGLLNLYQQIMAHKIGTHRPKPKLKVLVVTKGVYYPNSEEYNEEPLDSPENSTVWGLTKNFISECQHIDTKLIDVSTMEDHLLATKLISGIFEVDSADKFLFLRNGKIEVQRLVDVPRPNMSLHLPRTDRYNVIPPSSGTISDLTFAPTYQPTLSDHSVEISVQAVGLNFRDLMVILKPDGYEHFLPESTREYLGMDICGKITRLGSKVRLWSEGDEVIGLTTHGLRSHTTIHEKCLAAKPSFMSWSGGATIPTVFLTSCFTLLDIAQISSNDSVLIHVGSGGVGLAAIQVAKYVGARIYTTAGTSRKRHYLTEILGLTHVYNSRNTDFGPQILNDTNGLGVSVVLNSLTGPNFKEASLECCGEGGKFIEIGKVNIWTEDEVKSLRPDVEYHVVDLYPRIMVDGGGSDELVPKYMSLFTKLFEDGTYKELRKTVFPLEKVKDAFTYFQKAKHIGKIIVKMPSLTMEMIDAPSSAKKFTDSHVGGKFSLRHQIFEPQATYLITGGLGGIGLEVAKWMISTGAKYIVLVGRNTTRPEQLHAISHLNTNPEAHVLAMSANVGDFHHCRKLLHDIAENPTLPPLRGIFLASGLILDSLISNQSWDKFNDVFNSKVYSAWNLHNLTMHLNLDFFIMFSSTSASIGTLAQSNHSAACSYLDSLAHYRHNLGLVGSSINWGAWSDIGAASKLRAGQDGLFGYKVFTPKQGIRALEEFMLQQRCNQMTIFDWKDWRKIEAALNLKNYLNEVLNAAENNGEFGGRDGNGNDEAEVKLWNLVVEENEPKNKQLKMEEYLKFVLRNTLKLGIHESIDNDQELGQLGVDSLMTMELRNHLQKYIGSNSLLTANAMQDHHTISTLSTHLISILQNPEDTNISENSTTELVKEDCKLPNDILSINLSQIPRVDRSKIQHILLTGATGFFGPHVLHELLTKTKYKITCLIRAKTLDKAKSRLSKALKKHSLDTSSEALSKINIVLGNIVLDKFGLSTEDYYDLASSVDAVLHCAGKVHLLELYELSERDSSLRSVNVLGLLNILRFVITTKIKLLYHSSYLNVITDLTPDGLLTEHPLTFQDYSEELRSGYIVSKFIGEVLISQLQEKLGIPCTILRFPVLWWANETVKDSSKNDRTEDKDLALRSDAFAHPASFLKACIKLRKFPYLEDEEGGFPIMLVNIASNLMVQLLSNSDSELGVYNLFTNTCITQPCLNELMTEAGLQPNFLPMQEWRDAIFDEANLDNNTLLAYKYLYEDGNKEIRLFEIHPLVKLDKKIPNWTNAKFVEKMSRNVLNVPKTEKSVKDILKVHFNDILV